MALSPRRLKMPGAGIARVLARFTGASFAFHHPHDGGEAGAGPCGQRGPLQLTTAPARRRHSAKLAPKTSLALRKRAARRTSATSALVPAAAQARGHARGTRLAPATPRAAVCTATPPPYGGAWSRVREEGGTGAQSRAKNISDFKVIKNSRFTGLGASECQWKDGESLARSLSKSLRTWNRTRG